MPARSSWQGFLNLSLVSIPVKAYTSSVSGGGEIRLNQLHGECNSRIRYKKTCPIHGEVSNDEIVSGFEHSKGQYVVVDPDEIDKLRTQNDKSISIVEFISPDALDPVYYTGKSYYLIPDGPIGQKPYTVLHRGMIDENRYAVAQVVISEREQLMLIRPREELLVMTALSYENEVKKPAAFKDELAESKILPQELKLITTLIEASTNDRFDLARYKDVYIEKLTALIESKVAGREVVSPPESQEPRIINLMDALRESVARAQRAPAANASQKTTTRRKPAAKGKRKAG